MERGFETGMRWKMRVWGAKFEVFQKRSLLELDVPVGSITKIVNAQMERPVTYNTYRYYIAHDEELKPLLANRKGT